MKAKVLFRISAFFMLIHLVGHSIGHSTWKEAKEPAKQEVIRQMTGPKFEFMGVMRSMGDYFEGYGTLLSVFLLIIIAHFWVASSFVDQYPSVAKKVILPIAIGLLIFGVIEFIYFFPFAASISALAGISGIVGVVLINKNK